MAPRTRFTIAKADIISRFDAEKRRVFRKEDIARLLRENRAFWRLAHSTRTDDLIAWLTEKSHLSHQALVFPSNPPRSVSVYTWRDATVFEMSLAMGPVDRTYLSHFTAVALHGLTDQVPKNVYVCVEQSKRQRTLAALTQEMIDDSMAKLPRESHLVAPCGDYRISVVSATRSRALGVAPLEVASLAPYPLAVTDLERTLIDIAVRPHYSGGIAVVLGAYRVALQRVSVNRLRAYLSKLDYLYPYHQSVGFLLEAAGADRKALAPLESLPRNLDMPLVRGVDNPRYSARWKVRFPKGLV